MASELSIRLSQEERSRIARRHTSDPEAYALYTRGRFLISLGQAERAVELLESAVSRDPEYAVALATLADIYSRLPIAADVPSGEAIPKAKAAALEALQIDPGLAEAYTALGWITFYYEWDWAASEANHLQALRIKPNDFSVRLG
jgi:tetratricopeptide (TPR) repeat protein